jgi:hypothetical protein
MIMSAGKRFFWLVVLLVFLGGCGGYRQVSLAEDGRGDEFGLAEDLKTGDRVRLILRDGNVVEGIVEQFGDTTIVLDPLEGDGPVRSHPMDEIHSIERYASGSGKHLGMFILGYLVIAGVAFAIWANSSEGLM